MAAAGGPRPRAGRAGAPPRKMLASRQNSEILERAKASGAADPFGVAIAACRLRGEVANAAEEGEPIPNVHAIQLESTACRITTFLADDEEALAMMAMTSAPWWKAARRAEGYRLHTFQDADVGETGLVVLDGRLVAAGVEAGVVRAWEAATGRVTWTYREDFRNDSGESRCLGFGEDGPHDIAVLPGGLIACSGFERGGDDPEKPWQVGIAHVLDAATGQLRCLVDARGTMNWEESDDLETTSVEFEPLQSGHLLAWAGEYCVDVEVWHPAEMPQLEGDPFAGSIHAEYAIDKTPVSPVHVLRQTAGHVVQARALENSLVAINTSDGSLCIWDAAGGTKLHTLITGTVSQEDWERRLNLGYVRFSAYEGGRLVVDDDMPSRSEAWDFTTGAPLDVVSRPTKKLQHKKQLDGGLLVGGTRRDREAGFWIYRGSPQVSQR